MKKTLNIIVLFFGFILMLVSCKQTGNQVTYENPEIKAGIARISGNIEGYSSDKEMELRLLIPNPITMVPTTIEIEPDSNGMWNFEVATEFSPLFCSIMLQDESNWVADIVSFIPDKEMKINYTINDEGNWEAEIIEGTILFSEDFKSWSDLFMEMVTSGKKYDYINLDSVYRYIESPKDYVSFIMKYDLGTRLEIAQNDTVVPERGKSYMSNEIKLKVLESNLMSRQEALRLLLINTREDKSDTFKYIKPDISYYSFLEEFDLNNPMNLYNPSYSHVLRSILEDEILNIPPIAEIPIDEWLKITKSILAGLVGFDDGIFYDVLVGNVYSLQFENKLEPLSDKQKSNIQDYYGSNEIARILLRKNEDVVRLSASKSKVIINEIPDVSNEKLLETILDKYKGKVVMVDFWATWCGPCVEAMREMRTLKAELKDVTFVYITNESSPQTQWMKMLEGIGGEHYYLKEDEWDFILDKYGFSSIPTYIFFDKNGELKEQITGYPGNDKVKEIIKRLQ